MLDAAQVTTMLDRAKSIDDPKERARYELALRHRLAMQSVGAVRVLLMQHKPFLEMLLNGEQAMLDVGVGVDIKNRLSETKLSKSLQIQRRLAEATLAYMSELDAIGLETLETMSSGE